MVPPPRVSCTVHLASLQRPLSCACSMVLQGVDLIAGGRNKTKHRSTPKSENVYLLLLVKVRAARARWARRSMLLPPPARAASFACRCRGS